MRELIDFLITRRETQEKGITEPTILGLWFFNDLVNRMLDQNPEVAYEQATTHPCAAMEVANHLNMSIRTSLLYDAICDSVGAN